MPPQINSQFPNSTPPILNSNKNSKFILVALLILIIAGIYFLYKYLNITTVPYPNQESPSAIQERDKMLNWKTYRNEEYGFEIKYPPDFSVQENKFSSGFQVFFNENNTKSFNLTIRENHLGANVDLKNYFYLDFPIKNEDVLSKKIAYTYEAPNGYCDGPGCSSPFVAIVTKRLNDVFSIQFDGDTVIDNIERGVINSFKFISTSTPVTTKLKVCPDEWIQNNMPTVGESNEERQYYILNGERKEIAEFDTSWVGQNCNLEKQIVY